jgi:hypothetical protein
MRFQSYSVYKIQLHMSHPDNSGKGTKKDTKVHKVDFVVSGVLNLTPRYLHGISIVKAC